MKILKPVLVAIIIMIVGKVYGYSEELIINLVKFIIGFEIFFNANFIIKKTKNSIELSIKFFTKN